MRKGLWSPEEDEQLRRCIHRYTNGSWSEIAKKAGLDRCGKSCRRRWMNHLRPELKRGRFSPSEIHKVVELQQLLGNRWSEIAAQLVGRTDNDVKNLWNTQIKRRLLGEVAVAAGDHDEWEGTDVDVDHIHEHEQQDRQVATVVPSRLETCTKEEKMVFGIEVLREDGLRTQSPAVSAAAHDPIHDDVEVLTACTATSRHKRRPMTHNDILLSAISRPTVGKRYEKPALSTTTSQAMMRQRSPVLFADFGAIIGQEFLPPAAADINAAVDLQQYCWRSLSSWPCCYCPADMGENHLELSRPTQPLRHAQLPDREAENIMGSFTPVVPRTSPLPLIMTSNSMATSHHDRHTQGLALQQMLMVGSVHTSQLVEQHLQQQEEELRHSAKTTQLELDSAPTSITYSPSDVADPYTTCATPTIAFGNDDSVTNSCTAETTTTTTAAALHATPAAAKNSQKTEYNHSLCVQTSTCTAATTTTTTEVVEDWIFQYIHIARLNDCEAAASSKSTSGSAADRSLNAVAKAGDDHDPEWWWTYYNAVQSPL